MIVLGLVNGYFNDVSSLKVLVTPTLFLMIYPMMINLKITDLFQGFSNPKPLVLSIGINFIISPITAFLLSKFFFYNNPMLMVGLILISLIPTSGMTASWTGLANGNMKLALLIISTNLLLSILIIPVYMKLFIGEAIIVETMTIISSLLKVVIIPLVLGDITRRILIWKYNESGFNTFRPYFGAISSVGVLVIVFIAISLKSKTIINQSSLVIYSLIPLILYYGILLIASHLVGKRFLNKADSIALIYGSTMRNLTISLGLSLSVLEVAFLCF
jgi:ACR3 family arsenite efflux pump ArsB